MTDRIGLIGLDQPESQSLSERLGSPVIAHDMLPRMQVQGEQLLIESSRGFTMLPVSRVVYHGIFENDLDFLAGLALWNGPCLPSARGMMDCRLKLPCLVRALRHTRFPIPGRGFTFADVPFEGKGEWVAKWGNWHCGENKERFRGPWTAQQPSILEPFLSGQAVRIVVMGSRAWQIRMEGDGWLKSIHHPKACFTEVDAELVADTRTIAQAFGLEIVANDYMVADDGSRYLLEVNHIPNVTQFPELWEAYCDLVVQWVMDTPNTR